MIVVVAGVSGVGKSAVGELLAQQLGWKFYDADSFHPAANIEKMKRGIPLTDADRQPWLERLRELIERCLIEGKNAVLACSALKKAYRDRLRVNDEVKIVFLRGSRDRVAVQLQHRSGHFMNPALLDSQFDDLEEPGPSEDVFVLDITTPLDSVERIKTKLQSRS